MVKYGFDADARQMVDKSVTLSGRDYEKEGALQEYYRPDTGEPMVARY